MNYVYKGQRFYLRDQELQEIHFEYKRSGKNWLSYIGLYRVNKKLGTMISLQEIKVQAIVSPVITLRNTLCPSILQGINNLSDIKENYR